MTQAAYILDSPPPQLSCEAACALASQHFGINGEAVELVAERDQNFRIETPGGTRYVLKVSNTDVSRASLDFQAGALQHLHHTDPDLPAPRVIATLGGESILSWEHPDGEQHFVRMLSFLGGEFVRHNRAPASLQSNMGRFLARLDRALEGYSHPGYLRDLAWDISNTDQLRDLTGLLDDAGLRALVEEKLDAFEQQLRPAMQGLRRQVIHNDFNPDNVLVDPGDADQLSGIIDFGDMVTAPLVCDLAVASSYQLSRGPDPVGDLLPMLTGYHQVNPLLDEELQLLKGLVECRLIATLLIPAQRAAAHPENSEYLLEDNASAGVKLANLAAVDPSAALARFRSACAGARS